MDHRTSEVPEQRSGHPGTGFAVIGATEAIRDILCGPQQHNEHCKGWRWHIYVQDDKKRFQAVMAEVRKMRDERRAREAFAEAAE